MRPNHAPGPLAVPVLLLLALACRPAELEVSEAAARIGSEEIPYTRFEAYLELNVGESETAPLTGQTLSRLFDRFLEEELLYRMAVAEEVAGENDDRRQAIEALMGDEAVFEPVERQVAEYYDSHRESFQRPERVRLRQILVADRPKAQEALDALRAGEDFAAVAQRLSIDPTAPFGGLQGEFSRQDLPTRFVEPIFGLGEGEISEPVTAEYGVHIFQVTERFAGELVPYDQAQEEIRRRLRRGLVESRLQELLTQARRRYNVAVYESNLPFEYRGQNRASNIDS